MQTYESMNQKIVGILRISDDPSTLYAAQRIEELETALAERDGEIERERARAERLAAALEFYADPENWEVVDGVVTLAAGVEMEVFGIPTHEDRGDQARRALAEGRDGA